MTPKLLKPLAVSALLIATLAEPATAHHSFQMFDLQKRMSLTGVVQEFQWANPHSFVEFVVTDPDGKPVKWSIESQASGVLRRRGWKVNSLVPGDKVTVEFSPMRSGEHGGFLRSVTKADGTVFRIGG